MKKFLLLLPALAFCGSWSSPEEIGESGKQDLYQDVAISDDGSAIAVWLNNTDEEVAASIYNGTSWGAPLSIASAVGTGIVDPKISMNSDGNALIVYEDFGGGDLNVYAVVYNGTSFASASKISTSTSSTDPVVALSDDGTGIAVWNKSFDGVQAVVYDGSSWSTPEQIAPSSDLDVNPVVSINATGTAFAIWRNNSEGQVEVVKYSGSWGTAQVFASDGWRPQVSINASGKALAIWYEQGVGVLSSYYNGSSWTSPTTVQTVTNTSSILYPQIVLNDSNEGLAIWRNPDTGTVESTTFAGGTPSTVVTVATQVSSLANLQLGFLGTGGGLASWWDGSSVYASEYSDSSWSTAAKISGSTSASISGPSMGLNSSGTGVGCWIDSDETATNVSIYSPSTTSIAPVGARIGFSKNLTRIAWRAPSGGAYIYKLFKGSTDNLIWSGTSTSVTFADRSYKAPTKYILQTTTPFNQTSSVILNSTTRD